MKKSLISLAVLGALGSSMVSYAQEATLAAKEEKPSYTLAYNVGLFSQYIWRGLTQTDNKPALQGGVDFTHDSGFYLGAWGSNISWLTDSIGETGSGDKYYSSGGSLEVDLYGGYRTEIAKTGIGLDVGVLQYWYPGKVSAGMAKANATELYGALSYKWLQGKYSGLVSSDGWGFGDTRGASYMELNLTVPVGDLIDNSYMKGVSVIAHAGRVNLKCTGCDIYNYTDYKLGASKAFDSGLTVGAYWTDTNNKSENWQMDGQNIGRSLGTVFVQKTF